MRELMIIICLIACPVVAPSQQARDTIRTELERLYAENTAAFLRWDLAAVMALRAPDFHSISPDGTLRDRAAMENYIQGVMNGIKEWKSITFTIDSLTVAGDTAFAIVTQHLDRMALRPDNQVHHVETWVTQREAWVRHGARWRMWRVDQLRNQRRIIDGQPGSQQPSGPTRAQQLAASFNKHKDVVRQKRGVTKAKYLDVRSEPLVTQNVKDYAGVYEITDLGYAIEIEVDADGSVAAHGTDGTRGSFRLQNARIEDALLTGRKIYFNGQAERFEGVFLTRIQHESRSDPGSMTVGLGIVLSTPFEFGGNTYERLFYKQVLRSRWRARSG